MTNALSISLMELQLDKKRPNSKMALALQVWAREMAKESLEELAKCLVSLLRVRCFELPALRARSLDLLQIHFALRKGKAFLQ